MPKRRISSFAPRGMHRWSPGEAAGAFGELEPLSDVQRARLQDAARFSGRTLGEMSFEFIETLRDKFYRASSRKLASSGYTEVRDELEAFRRSLAGVVRVLEHGAPCHGAIVEAVASAMGERAGALYSLSARLRAAERSAAECGRSRHRSLDDVESPFEGLVAELSWWWRHALDVEPTVSKRLPVSAFVRFVHAFMMTLPARNRLHAGGVVPIDMDSWGALTQAIWRAQRVTREFQSPHELARRLAWGLSRVTP